MFEENFAKFVGSKYSIMVSSGTAAIKVALIAAKELEMKYYSMF